LYDRNMFHITLLSKKHVKSRMFNESDAEKNNSYWFNVKRIQEFKLKYRLG